jgi:hypothetical protein
MLLSVGSQPAGGLTGSTVTHSVEGYTFLQFFSTTFTVYVYLVSMLVILHLIDFRTIVLLFSHRRQFQAS